MGTYDTIPFHNYTDLGFTFQYNRENYIVGSGETKNWPPFIVYHGAKHLIDRELVRNGEIKLLNDQTKRAELMSKIVVSADRIKEEPEHQEATIQVEEEFPDLKDLNPAGFKSEKVDLSRKEMFAKVREMGYKLRATVTNDELKKIIENKNG